MVGQRCCWTPYLNTNDDNWERGETNFFIGSAQIGSECHGFAINDGEHVELTLKHKGNDGGHLDYVSVHGAFGILDHFYMCRSRKSNSVRNLIKSHLFCLPKNLISQV